MSASHRKILANRINARRSTGPRSSQGKERSKQNSRLHGLSVATNLAPSRSREVTQLADAIAGPNPDAARRYFATIAAEAHHDLIQVQTVRMARLGSKLRDDPASLTEENQVQELAAVLVELNRLDRYEQRALARRNRALALL